MGELIGAPAGVSRGDAGVVAGKAAAGAAVGARAVAARADVAGGSKGAGQWVREAVVGMAMIA